MKTRNYLVIAGLVCLVCIQNVRAQNIIKISKEHKISAKAGKPGALIDFSIDKDQNELSLKYITKDNKKKIEYETYSFDLSSLEHKNMQETEIEKEKARKMFRNYDDREPMRFVRVQNNIARQMVLEKGYIRLSQGSNWSTSAFVSEQKEKFKDPEDRTQTMVAYRSDANKFNFQFNTFSDAFKQKSGYAATGNALVVTMVKPKKFKKGEFAPGTVFNTMLISSNDFSIIKEQQLLFEKPHFPFSGTNTPDGGMALVFIPMNKGALAAYSVHAKDVEVKQNLNEYILLTIDAEGNETGRFPFEVKHVNANLKISITADGGFLLKGFADKVSVAADDLQANHMPVLEEFQLSTIEAGLRISNPVSLELIKVSKTGETVFSTSTPLEKLLQTTTNHSGEKVKMPKAKDWEKVYKSEVSEGLLIEYEERVYLQYSFKDLHQLLQFDRNGNFEISYFTPKDGDVHNDSQIVMAPNSSFYWMNFEHKEGKPNEMWMKILHIDPLVKSIQSIEVPGEQKYFVLGDSSFGAAPGSGEVVIYLQNGKNVFLGKLPIQ